MGYTDMPDWRGFVLGQPRPALLATVRTDGRPPCSFATLSGTATLVDDLAQVRSWAARIGGRYMD